MNAQMNLLDEITVDGFCGGGGWSTGFEIAIGAPVDIGINHDAAAIALHKANHPFTKHYNENIWEVNPQEACAGRPVGWAHFSPDCKHFSRAKGAKPVEKKIRGLAWVIVKWAGTVKPRIISMENVPEFMTWGPLIAVRGPHGGVMRKDGTEAGKHEYTQYKDQQLAPDKRRQGETFKQFVKELEAMGYICEFKMLRACDYGAPTTRTRMFGIFRRDGKPIIWPSPTHGEPNSLEVKSGKLKPWVPAAKIIDWENECPSIFERKKPLAENTLRRIARGIQKFVIENPDPFIVQVSQMADKKIAPLIASVGQTGAGDGRCSNIKEPVRTIVSKAEHCLVTPIITKFQQNSIGQIPTAPLDTVMAGATRFGVVAPTLIQYHTEQTSGEHRGQDLENPLQTVDASNRYGLAAATLVQFNNHCDGLDITHPLPAITAHGLHFAEVRAFLIKFYGSGTGQKITEPLDTITTKDRFGIVTIKGENYQIVDIGLRMLSPRELYRAQGFPDDYEIEKDCYGRAYPKKEQVARCGNAVPPPFATALARANWPEKCKNVNLKNMMELNNFISA